MFHVGHLYAISPPKSTIIFLKILQILKEYNMKIWFYNLRLYQTTNAIFIMPLIMNAT
jgi:hypothetical protein